MTRLGTFREPDGRGALNGHRPPAAAPARDEPWRVTVRFAAVFAKQVLLRPLRIGTLILLAAAVVAVVVGAQGWWVVLGVVLFQTAGSSLIVLWTGGDRAEADKRSPRRTELPAPRRPEPDREAEEAEPPAPEVPGQRDPGEE